MKFFTVLNLILFFLLFTTNTVSSQSLLERAANKAKERLENKAEKKIDEKVDQKIDEGFDKIEDSLKKEEEESAKKTQETSDERSQRRMQGILKGIGVSGEPVPYDEAYSFSTKIQMHIETIDGKGKKISDGEFITYMNPKDMNFAYEVLSGDVGNKGKGVFILDFKNKASIILSEEEGKKTGLVYGLNFMLDENAATEELTSEEIDNSQFTTLNPYVSKTGKTKKIQGYSCDEFHYNNPEEQQEAWYWITKDLDIKTREFFGTLFSAATFSSGMGWGYLMESETLDKKSGEKTRMLVTDISTNAGKEFSVKNYQVTNIGSLNIPSGNEN
jgi:hypothetical protein